MTGSWWDAPFRTFQTNLREIDAGLDVERTLDFIESYGADTWLLSVGGIIANYPSALTSQTVNPALSQRRSGDLVGDAVAAAALRGIRVLGRMDFSKIDARRAEQNPHWCFVSPEGEPQVYNGYSSVCPSADYYQHEMFGVIAEVLSRYPLAGFFFNWMSFNEVDYSRIYRGVCQCQACQKGFEQFAPGITLPRGPESDGYATWKSFSQHVLADLDTRMRRHLRELAPEAALILGDRADITFHEANNAVGRPLWHLATAEAVSAARSLDPRRPVFVNSVAFVDMPYRWAGEDPARFEQYLLQAISHGANPSTYIMGTPEDSPFAALEAGAVITRFHRDHQDLYDGLRSSARVALVRPPGVENGEVTPRSEFEGWHLAFVESHVPVDTVALHALSTLDIDRFDAVVLPDVGQLNAEDIASLNAFAHAGGTVIATGGSAWDGESFQLSAQAPPVAHLSEYITEESVRALHVAVADEPPFLVPVVDGFRVVEAGRHAETGWHLVGSALYGPPEKCYGNEATAHPGWVQQGMGAGTLVIVPWRPGHVYRQLGLGMLRDAMVKQSLGAAGQHLCLRTTLPQHVHVVPGVNVRADILHLLNRSGHAPQRFVEPLPISPGEIRVGMPERPACVWAHVAQRDLEWGWADGVLKISTPELGLFEAIEIRRNAERISADSALDGEGQYG